HRLVSALWRAHDPAARGCRDGARNRRRVGQPLTRERVTWVAHRAVLALRGMASEARSGGVLRDRSLRSDLGHAAGALASAAAWRHPRRCLRSDAAGAVGPARDD